MIQCVGQPPPGPTGPVHGSASGRGGSSWPGRHWPLVQRRPSLLLAYPCAPWGADRGDSPPDHAQWRLPTADACTSSTPAPMWWAGNGVTTRKSRLVSAVETDAGPVVTIVDGGTGWHAALRQQKSREIGDVVETTLPAGQRSSAIYRGQRRPGLVIHPSPRTPIPPVLPDPDPPPQPLHLTRVQPGAGN